jgi:hypothetical protein
MTRPGTQLRALAARLLDPSTMERLIDPAIADLQSEHADALRLGRVWQARRVRLAGYVAFWKVAAIGLSRGSARALIAPHHGAIGRTIRFSGLATTALTLLFMGPPAWNSLSHPGHRLAIFLWLVPQALAVALPMGVVFGVLCGLRGRIATARERQAIVGLTIASSLAMIVFVGWILPVSNQVFREVTFGGPVARGTNELTIAELASGRLTEGRSLLLWGTLTRRVFEFHFRLALAFAPLVLGVFALGIAGVRRRVSNVVGVGALALVSCFAYYTLLYYARSTYYARLDTRDHALAIVAAWSPNLAFLASALPLWMIRRRGPSAAGPSRLDDGPRSGDRPVVPLA